MEIVITIVSVIIFITIVKSIGKKGAKKKEERRLEELRQIETTFKGAIHDPLATMRKNIKHDLDTMLKTNETAVIRGVQSELQSIIPQIQQAKEN
jgi:hypothetical protein